MSQALYRKWRPGRFDEVVGQEHITRSLKNSIMADRVGHAYLFCGPRGTGKTTSARLLAKAVNCLSPDVKQRPCDECRICKAISEGRFMDLIEIDAASNTGVDDIRDLRDKINFSPSDGRFKVYIIDEVHMLSTAAFNALLKTLEEPPPHAKFILATTEEHKVPMTIKSRCQQFHFRLLTTQEIITRLDRLVENEGLQVEPEALALVAQHGAGSLRDSESLLDQLISSPNELVTVERAQQILGTASSSTVRQLAEAVITNDGVLGLQVIQEALTTGADARQLCRQMVAYWRDLLLLQTAGNSIQLNLTPEQQASMLAQAQRAHRRTLLEATKQFNEAANAPATSWQPHLPLELAFIQSLPGAEPPPAVYTPPTTPVAHQPAVAHPPVASSATPSPTHVPAASSPSAGLSIDLIKGKAWRELMARAEKINRNFKPWLSQAQPLAFEGQTLILIFTLPLIRDKLDHEREIIGKILSDILGKPIQIKCVMKDEYGLTPAGEDVRSQAESLARELGGVIKESKTKP